MSAAVQLSMFAEPAPRIEQVPTLAPARVQRGDLWQLGAHRLLCGDATNAGDVARLMGGAKVSACITDPPYGVTWNTNYKRFTDKRCPAWEGNKKYPPVYGDDRAFDPRPLLGFRSVVLWGANNYSDKLPAGAWLIWDKRGKNGVAFLADGEAAWMNHGRSIHIMSKFFNGPIGGSEGFHHPTQKPIALMEWCIEKAKAGNAVYDPYCGSGPVLLACERTERRCYGMEIEPHYCDIILRRWEQATGKRAALLERMEVSA